MTFRIRHVHQPHLPQAASADGICFVQEVWGGGHRQHILLGCSVLGAIAARNRLCRETSHLTPARRRAGQSGAEGRRECLERSEKRDA